MIYKKEFLILELQRFYVENDRVPTSLDMTTKNGYPTAYYFMKYFETWNNALVAAGFKINQTKEKRTGLETCINCGCNREQTSQWITKGLVKGEVICHSCYLKSFSDYKNGNLDINSPSGRGRSGEILVAKVLNIGKEHDCNRISCAYKFDLYNEEYGKIDVKTSLLTYKKNIWSFIFGCKKEAKTYICIGLSTTGKSVERVWIVPNEGKIRNLMKFSVTNTRQSLSNRNHWEADSKPYIYMWQTMKLDNCKTMINKSKGE